MFNPERDSWPSVEDAAEPACDFCEAMPDEPHQPSCPLSDGTHEANDVLYYDRCGYSYVTVCGCDQENER